ncbi:expressed unknown protein [Seminavis robusta]|uniref:BTB domain-containing protein n=1 Tax=Seminavis robusta TaxID=568900 RepID=A0A9N8ESW8_9STRA|nr:expressed unknown protein [Seminavis robusta]|eukprot:Sro1591_g284440.1 n/a (316) ;mRNA; r:791-1738
MNNNNTDKEVPLGKVLSIFLTDDGLKDVTLITSDGELVRANHYVLSARSVVFRRLLRGNYFSEATNLEVDVGFPGSIMRDIVEYSHTDTCASLSWNNSNNNTNKQSPLEEWHAEKEHVETLVGLSGAAMYYNLPSLAKKIETNLTQHLRRTPSLSLAVLAACRKGGPSIPVELVECAMASVRRNKSALFDEKAVACVNDSLVKEILKDKDLKIDEYDLFMFLTQWMERSPKDRESVAKDLSINIRLEKINPEDLHSSVSSSGLFAPDEIHEAYRKQALEAQQSNHAFQIPSFQQTKSIAWRKLHSVSLWVSSNSS